MLSSDVLDGLEDEEAGDDEDEDEDADGDDDDEEEEDGEDDDDDGECDDEFPTTELLLCTEPISNWSPRHLLKYLRAMKKAKKRKYFGESHFEL